MSPLIGQTLAHYRITAALGAGGMGEVYRATDTKLGREVAIKVLPAEMAASPERLDRFRREAKALAARCSHSTCTPIAQMMPSSSRPMAVVTFSRSFPLARSRR